MNLKKNSHALKRVAILMLMIVVAAQLGLPFFWMVSTAFKTSKEIHSPTPIWLPSGLNLENFQKAFQAAPFGRYMLNTLMVAAIVTLTTVILCAMAGYGFGRIPFPGREGLFILFILAMALPGEVTLIPRFLIAKNFPLFGGNDLLGRGGRGLIDSYAGLIIPNLMSVFGVFLLRQFFRTLPGELEDAARIDGASEFAIFWRVMLPLAGPALATLALFTFTGVWDEFIWPLVILNDSKKYVIQLGLSVFFGEHTVDWGPLMAASSLISLPVIAVFLFAQASMIKSIATTGLKG
jgi:multiple sugar transport system permease protein